MTRTTTSSISTQILKAQKRCKHICFTSVQYRKKVIYSVLFTHGFYARFRCLIKLVTALFVITVATSIIGCSHKRVSTYVGKIENETNDKTWYVYVLDITPAYSYKYRINGNWDCSRRRPNKMFGRILLTWSIKRRLRELDLQPYCVKL